MAQPAAPQEPPVAVSTERPGGPPAALRPRELVRSLRVLGALAVVLTVLAYAGVGFYRYQQIRAETALRIDRALRIASEHALKVLDTNETLLARVMDAVGPGDPALLGAREASLHAQLRGMSRNRPQIESIWVHDAKGHPVATDRQLPAPHALDVTDRSFFRWHRDRGGGLYVSEIMVGRTTGRPFFDMSRGLYGPDGQFLGTVSVRLSPEYFERFHDDLAADEPGLAITMFRADGQVLSRWPLLPGAPSRMSPNSPVLTRVRAGATSGAAHGVSSIDGRMRLLFFQRTGDYPVYVGTGMAVSEIRQRWLQEMAWLAAFGLPPLLGLLFAGRTALRRTRESLQAAERLHRETQARQRVEEALLQSQKLEALGRLTGGVAHDFNNALMVVSNNVTLIRLKHPQLATAQLDSIARAVGSATKLTRQLLAFSRRQALVPQVLRLQERLPGARELLVPVLGGRVALEITVAPDTRPIRVDPAEFELAVINLAINARDAMPAGGRLDLRAANATAHEVPPLTQPGPMVVVEIRDTGQGIPAELLAKVFDPFFTTKPVGQGTGLGLSQVYGLCQRAGGTATVASQVGQGTVVRLFFPATDEAASGSVDAPAPLAANLGLRVLLVEDNDEVAGPLRHVLETLGCRVTRLDRARAACEWLDTCSSADWPDVVLSDVVMPGDMDGLGLAQHVRAQHPRLRVLLMTGYAQQLEMIAAQGFEVLPKPCGPEVLVQALIRR